MERGVVDLSGIVELERELSVRVRVLMFLSGLCYDTKLKNLSHKIVECFARDSEIFTRRSWQVIFRSCSAPDGSALFHQAGISPADEENIFF